MARLNQLYRDYYINSQGKQQLRYTCFSAELIDSGGITDQESIREDRVNTGEDQVNTEEEQVNTGEDQVSAPEDNTLSVIKKAKRNLMDRENQAAIMEMNRDLLIRFQSDDGGGSLADAPFSGRHDHGMFATDINGLYVKPKEEDEHHFRLGIIKADLEGLEELFDEIGDYCTYRTISETINKHMVLEGLADSADCCSGGQRGWLFPIYIAGEDILFAVSIANLVKGIEVCHLILKEINDELRQSHSDYQLSMSIGAAIVFNTDPISHYLKQADEQVGYARSQEVAVALERYWPVKVAINNVTWIEMDERRVEADRKSLPGTTIDRVVAHAARWQDFKKEVELLATVKSDAELRERIGTTYFFSSLLEKLTGHQNNEKNEMSYINQLFHHIRPRYGNIDKQELCGSKGRAGAEICKAEMLISRGILRQLYQSGQKIDGVNKICFNPVTQKRLADYLRLMVLFSEQPMIVPSCTGTKVDTHAFRNTDSILKAEVKMNGHTNHRWNDETISMLSEEVISAPIEYLYHLLDKNHQELRQCFVDGQDNKNGFYLKSIRIDKAIFFRLRRTKGGDLPQLTRMIKAKNRESRSAVFVKNQWRKHHYQEPCYKYFDKAAFARAVEAGAWKSDFIDSMMLLYDYYDLGQKSRQYFRRSRHHKN
jgi:hypothetical protein